MRGQPRRRADTRTAGQRPAQAAPERTDRAPTPLAGTHSPKDTAIPTTAGNILSPGSEDAGYKQAGGISPAAGREMKNPDYFVIGAPKCGTTTVAYWLEQTESVFMTNPKEPHYYSTDYVQKFQQTDLKSYREKADYAALFSNATSRHMAVGEASTHYLASKDAVPNILNDNPQARFIICLRNPIDMARSMHAHALYWGNETIASFEKAWRMQEERRAGRKIPSWQPNPQDLQYRNICALGTQLVKFRGHAPDSDVLYVFTEDLRQRKEEVYHEMISFLGAVPGNIRYDSRNITRDRISIRFNSFYRLVRHNARGKRSLRAASLIGGLNDRYNTRKNIRSDLSPDFQRELADHFLPEIKKMEEITGRDLSHWL